MLYEIDFTMPIVHSGHPIGMAEGQVSIQTFNHRWWIVEARLRNSETNELFQVGKGGPMFGVIQTWVEYDKSEQIEQLIQQAAA